MPESTRANKANKNESPLEAGVGASDATNGGGAGAGVPDGDTALRAGDTVTKGDVKEDRKKLFPEAGGKSPGTDAKK